jgi:hypothetical protein
MVSISELKQLKDYYEEKIAYLQYLINHELHYSPEEKAYKHECYKYEISELKKSIQNINEDIGETKKVERKYTPGRVKVKKTSMTKVKTTRSKSKRSTSPTLSEKIEDIRKNFPKILKSMNKVSKVSKTKVKKSTKSRSRSKSRSQK